MDTYSLAAAARALGTSAPRVRRAVDRLGMRVQRTASGVFRLTQEQVDELALELGVGQPAPAQLDVRSSAPFIARRLITSFDPDGLAWGTANLPAAAWEHAAATRGLEPAQRALAHNLAQHAAGDPAGKGATAGCLRKLRYGRPPLLVLG